MINRFHSFFLVVIFSLGGVFLAEAKTIRCDTLFQPTVAEVIEQVDHDHSDIFFKGQSFDDYSQSLSWMRKRKVRKLVQDLEVRNFPSAQALERYSIELGTALFGATNVVDRWIFKSKDERLEEATMILIKEQLLQQGLMNTWGRVQNPTQISALKRILDRIATLQNSRFAELLRLPFALPTWNNKQISSELMSKIIRDGFNAHADEARMALRRQDTVDAYNTFRKIYAPAFFGVMMIVQVEHAYAQLQATIDQQVQQTIEELRHQRESIEKNVPLIKQQEFQRAYDASVAEFKQKWGESPTPEEAALIKAKIEKALNMH